MSPRAVELDCQIKDNRQLHVLLLRARQLVAADHNGLSDPFVKLSFGGQRRSSSIKKRTLEPEWNERFVFAVHDASSMVQVECFDHDLLQNDPLGLDSHRCTHVRAYMHASMRTHANARLHMHARTPTHARTHTRT